MKIIANVPKLMTFVRVFEYPHEVDAITRVTQDKLGYCMYL